MDTVQLDAITQQELRALLPHPREAGVLLAISSLPSPYGIGTLGREAVAFLDFLRSAGQRYWQVLPVGPTTFGDSPYQSYSSFAGNPYFLDLEQFIEQGLLTREAVEEVNWGSSAAAVDYARLYQARFPLLRQAFQADRCQTEPEYLQFCKENAAWLEDYAQFMALKERFSGAAWLDWDPPFRDREPQAMAQAAEQLRGEMDFWRWCQYQFDRQWRALKVEAAQRGIALIGDVPIYVALDSADVWANRSQFQLDETGRPQVVAGVPPDAFSEQGQLWGNPLYRWDAMDRDGFSWWKRRMACAANRYDRVRIDHFIGLVRYFAVPAGADTAMQGSWQQGPGERLLRALHEDIDPSRIIAEDLGVVVEAVNELRDRMGYPGMRILQFAFDGNPDNCHLPEHYRENLLVYGGTHDNETLLGYFTARDWEARRAMELLQVDTVKDLPWAMVEAGYASFARIALFQAQDLLGLGNEARMNVPATLGGNWAWRLLPGQLTPELAHRLRGLARASGRLSLP